MNEEKEKNNLIIHRVGLYRAAYELSRSGFSVQVDSYKPGAQMVVRRNKKDISVMVRVLSGTSAVPFIKREAGEAFDYLLICTNVYSEDISYYKLKRSDAENVLDLETWKEGEEYRYIEFKDYQEFKADPLSFE